jgi:hypothetical protein
MTENINVIIKTDKLKGKILHYIGNGFYTVDVQGNIYTIHMDNLCLI